MRLILLALMGVELLPWFLLILGALLVFGAVHNLTKDNADKRSHKARMQESREREWGYRADAENLEWLLAGNYEGQFSTPTMPVTRPL